MYLCQIFFDPKDQSWVKKVFVLKRFPLLFTDSEGFQCVKQLRSPASLHGPKVAAESLPDEVKLWAKQANSQKLALR